MMKCADQQASFKAKEHSLIPFNKTYATLYISEDKPKYKQIKDVFIAN